MNDNISAFDSLTADMDIPEKRRHDWVGYAGIQVSGIEITRTLRKLIHFCALLFMSKISRDRNYRG